MSKTVLLIGGNGYIGSRLCFDLGPKYNLHNVDISWFGSFPHSEIKDYRNLTKSELSKFDAIILLAGHSSVKMCDGPITSSWNNNVNNFINLVEKLDKSQTLIYASSGSVYGSQNIITTEDIDLQFKPINNYDLTKYSLDIQAQKFIKEGYKIIGLRFGTVNGWSPNTRDELMINAMTKKSILENHININNKDITRPILGINDLTRAVDIIIQNPISGIYNLASFSDTVGNIGNKVSSILSVDINVNPDVKGAYDFVMDINKFKNTYNFEFKETIESIIDELTNKFDSIKFTNRNKFIDYE